MGSQERKLRRQANVKRVLGQARVNNATLFYGPATDELKTKIAKLLETPKYRSEIDAFAQACRTWRQYNPDLLLEWHDTEGVILSGDPSLEHVRKYLAKNDIAANMIQYADEATGRVCSLLQVQFALVGLGWLH